MLQPGLWGGLVAQVEFEPRMIAPRCLLPWHNMDFVCFGELRFHQPLAGLKKPGITSYLQGRRKETCAKVRESGTPAASRMSYVVSTAFALFHLNSCKQVSRLSATPSREPAPVRSRQGSTQNFEASRSQPEFQHPHTSNHKPRAVKQPIN